jgi:CRISPR/Cas system-associated exonuclease Cas4 (RecB family)
MAGQFYCELKVDNSFVKGEIQTEAKTEGNLLHGEILAMKETTMEQIVLNIEREEVYAASFPLASLVRDIVIAGIPDAIIFVQGKPSFVVELKTTVGDPNILYQDQEFQAGIYGLILEGMGFDCSALTLAIIRLRRKEPMMEEQRRKFLSIAMLALPANEPKLIERAFKGKARVHLVSFKKDVILQQVEWAKNYWLFTREPLPTKNPRKCKACEFNDTCPSSLWDPSLSTLT